MTRLSPALLVCLLTCLPLFAANARADAPTAGGGEVRVPLAAWQRLVEAGQGRGGAPDHALGRATVEVAVAEQGGRLRAAVTATLAVRVLGERGALVPLLPLATALESLTVNGEPAELVPTSDGLSWVAESRGSHTLALAWSVEAQRSASGWSLLLPLPRAASAELGVSLPGAGLEVGVVPAVAFRTEPAGDRTRLRATIPPAPSVLLTWLAPSRAGFTVSRASYQGELRGEALAWAATFTVDLDSGEAQVPLFPRSVTLSELSVDGRAASVALTGERFAVAVSGRGRHEIAARFESPVARADGPPRSTVAIPEVPMSRFELVLPGRKEVTVTPAAAVATTRRGAETVATVHAPMAPELTFSWSEAVPEETRAELSTNASLWHAIEAEEGVLHVRALVELEITRGETSLVELEVPLGLEVSRVSAASGGIADWRIETSAAAGPRRLSVFLDRKVRGAFAFEVHGEQLLGTGPEATARIPVPLLRAARVHRQRGMAALLMGRELGLEPIEEKGLTRVGESQLPPAFRDSLGKPVAATWKYVDAATQLTVKAVVPERKAGKLEVQIDTLVSIGEVSLRGRSAIALHVKSGSILELALELPSDVSVLGLTAPSLRTQALRTEGAVQVLSAEFTQEMEGDLRLDLAWERVLGEARGRIEIPLVAVRGAESEHGRIAVEALAAVEVRPAVAERVATVDVGELPQQLVLQTTNPILLAWKYVRGETAPRLALEIARHREAEVQAAAIDEARYQTLFTADGLSVTTAHFVVRNARRQFLELVLPAGSEVWSVFVDGRGEKPALAGPTDSPGAAPDPKVADPRPRVLIRLASSTAGFPIELVYATRGARLGFAGRLEALLARPDLVVTNTRWDVYLPDGPTWASPRSNLARVGGGETVDARAIGAVAERAAGTQAAGSLHLTVPARGIHYAFEKLYANQGGAEARLAIRYATGPGRTLGLALALLAAALLVLGIGRALGLTPEASSRVAIGGLVLGVALALPAVALLGASAWLIAGLAAAGSGALAVRAFRARRADLAVAPAAGAGAGL